MKTIQFDENTTVTLTDEYCEDLNNTAAAAGLTTVEEFMDFYASAIMKLINKSGEQ